MEKPDFALIGLGVMGRSLALNFADKGYKVAIFNRTAEKTAEFYEESRKKFPKSFFPVTGNLSELVEKVGNKGIYFMMINAGEPTYSTSRALFRLLSPGAIVVDLANSYFKDTIVLEEEAAANGIHFFGVGVSGGEEGARLGPSIMPGGSKEIYDKSLKRILIDISAKAKDGAPCVTYLGEHGAGHFVKMVHNGIEYADMQLIAEAYDFMRKAMDMSADEIASVFKKWNKGPLESFLIEAASIVLSEKVSGKNLVDQILDRAKMKGTGAWTIQSSTSLSNVVALPSIYSAVAARAISYDIDKRAELSKNMNIRPKKIKIDINDLEKALYLSKIAVYAQGIELIEEGYKEFGFGRPDISGIAKIWREGCIIRAEFLNDISREYRKQKNLLSVGKFSKALRDFGSLKIVCSAAIETNVSLMAFDASRNYILQLSSEKLPANLLQGLRDYFGAHTYERTDRKGSFHYRWQSDRKEHEIG